MSWLDRWRAPRETPQAPPRVQAQPVEPVEEPEDPTRCPKRWMGRRCVLQTGHIGVCRWQ